MKEQQQQQQQRYVILFFGSEDVGMSKIYGRMVVQHGNKCMNYR